jgi:hypothetical protein
MTDRFRYQLIPILAALLALGVVLTRQWQTTGDLSGVPLDDAYIHYRFADNLASGHGFAFNPDEPTPGSTSPLWVVLLAAGELVGLSPILTSKVLGALAFIACAWLTGRIAWRMTGNHWLAAAAGALVVISGRMAWAALSGMETIAFAALTLLALKRLLDHPLDVPTSAILGLAALLRPEGYVLFAFILVWSAVTRRREPSFVIRHAAFVMAFAALIAPYILFALATTGSPWPNTFRANARELSSAQYLVQYVQYAVSDNPLVAVMAALGLVLIWPNRRTFREWPSVLWAIGFPLVAALVTPNLRHHGRYAIPLIPFNVLLAVVWVREYSRTLEPRFRQMVVLTIALGGVFFGATGGWRWVETFSADARDMTQMQVTMGRWIDANTPRNATLALSDIGAITYLSGRRVIDLVGLATPDILPMVAGQPVGLERDQAVFDYLARHRPDYVVIIPTWYPYLASLPGAHLVEAHTVKLDHTPSVGGGDHLRAYHADWSWLDVRAPQKPITADWGAIKLDGFDLAPGDSIQAGAPLTLTLHWRSVQPAGRFKVFVHLIDASGKIAAQHDGEPVGNLWPTHLWRPGDAIPDEHVIQLPANLPSGQYLLIVGMYNTKTGTRLALASGDDSLKLSNVEVTR